MFYNYFYNALYIKALSVTIFRNKYYEYNKNKYSTVLLVYAVVEKQKLFWYYWHFGELICSMSSPCLHSEASSALSVLPSPSSGILLVVGLDT